MVWLDYPSVLCPRVLNYGVGIGGCVWATSHSAKVGGGRGRGEMVLEMDAPAEEEEDKLQEKYIAELQRMWDEWKDTSSPDRKGELEKIVPFLFP